MGTEHKQGDELPCQLGRVMGRGTCQIGVCVLSDGEITFEMGPFGAEQRWMWRGGYLSSRRRDPFLGGMVTPTVKPIEAGAAHDGGALFASQRFLPGGVITIWALMKINLASGRF